MYKNVYPLISINIFFLSEINVILTEGNANLINPKCAHYAACSSILYPKINKGFVKQCHVWMAVNMQKYK